MRRYQGPYLDLSEPTYGNEALWEIVHGQRRFYTGCGPHDRDGAMARLHEYAEDSGRIPKDWLPHYVNNATVSSPCTVYFISTDAVKSYPIKIGRAIKEQSRLSSLQSGCPYPLRILATCPGSHVVEKGLHWRFAKYRLQGEWFRRGRLLMRFISELQAEAPQ